MERQRRPAAERQRGHSGVYRTVTPEKLVQLMDGMKAADERVGAFRADILERHVVEGDASLGWRALQEIDTAHEELRVAEEELQAQADEIFATRAALDAERFRYSELFDSAPEAYFVTDVHGCFIEANKRAGVLFNIDPAFLATKPLISLVTHADRGRFRDLLDAINDMRIEMDLRIQPRKADEHWVSLTAQRAAMAGGKPTVRWVMRSVHEQKLEAERQRIIEEELRERIVVLEAAQRAVGQRADHVASKEKVLGNVAHELRGPLASITGWLQLLNRDDHESGLSRRALTSMTRNANALGRLIEDLVDHTRFGEQSVKLEANSINLLKVVIEAIEDVRPIAMLKGIELRFSAHAYRIDTHADAARIQQVFRNLLGNAVKFTPEHGSIRVTVGLSGRRAVVDVTDSGHGIAPEALIEIFEPFVQAGSPDTRKGGLGLGLSIARRLVEMHGGTITAHSDGLEHGATFRVILPLAGLN